MSFEEEVTYYDPSESTEFVVLPKGVYNAWISDFEEKKTDWMNKENQVADIYEATYVLDTESLKGKTLRDSQGNEMEGEQFAGRSVRSKGFFLWRSPGAGDAFVSNPSGNKRLFILLGTVKYPMEKKVIENSKGAEVEVTIIPRYINPELLIGKAITIECGHREWNEKIYTEEFKITKWKDAPETRPETDDDDLPF
jgi:hypothetical protein|tara:strand:- start:61 stop:648 length:588 start_codon:yes stop_codon:yes gene_type:complete